MKPTQGPHVVVFTGGSGSGALVNQLLDRGATVTCLLNAYDDGKSTGRLREVFGILGPSDVRKNLLALMDIDSTRYWSLHEAFGYRFPAEEPREGQFRDEVFALAGGEGRAGPGVGREFTRIVSRLPQAPRDAFVDYLGWFTRALQARERESGARFSFLDCALGNCFLVGAYLKHGRDWEKAIGEVGRLLDTRGHIRLISDDDRHLVAVCRDGRVLASEWEVITASDGDIAGLFLSERRVDRAAIEGVVRAVGPEAALARLKEEVHSPARPTAGALEEVARADLIVYSPGTLHSSLLPSFQVTGVPEALAASRAPKVLVTNIVEEPDTRGYRCSDLVGAVLGAAGPGSVDRVIANVPRPGCDAAYHALDAEALARLRLAVQPRDLEDRAFPGCHRPATLAELLLQVVSPAAAAAAAPAEPPLVSVVVLAWNRKHEVEITLGELRKCSYENLELIVVDNGSTDGTARMVYEKFPEVRVVRLPRNEGMDGYNVGFATARGKYVVMLDDDSHPEPRSIETMVRVWESSPESRIGLMAFRVVNPNEGTLVTHLWEERISDVEAGRERVITSFPACGAAVRRDVLDEVGFFDEDFFVYATEDDLAVRIWEAGYQIVYEPRCLAYHRASGANRSVKRYGRGFRNAAWFNIKHVPLRLFPLVIPRNLFWIAARGVRFRSFPYFYYALLGYLAGYLRFWVPLRKRKVVRADVARFCLDDDWISRPVFRTLRKLIVEKRYVLEGRGITSREIKR
jgi:GT2 family glycosyltransferase/2-phospho-L-lactate transferase/gluconeogenesis factor (CofD/UPF0052 family)